VLDNQDSHGIGIAQYGGNVMALNLHGRKRECVYEYRQFGAGVEKKPPFKKYYFGRQSEYRCMIASIPKHQQLALLAFSKQAGVDGVSLQPENEQSSDVMISISQGQDAQEVLRRFEAEFPQLTFAVQKVESARFQSRVLRRSQSK